MNQYSENESEDMNEGGRPLELKFSLGYNSAMTQAVQNLTISREGGKTTKEIFYPAAHTGVIYNYETGESKLLQGHVSNIFCVLTQFFLSSSVTLLQQSPQYTTQITINV